MRENRDFVVPVNILTTFARAPFSWAARHTTVCLDQATHVHHNILTHVGSTIIVCNNNNNIIIIIYNFSLKLQCNYIIILQI